MTVKELEEILCTIKNKELPVYVSSYSTNEVEGYFFDEIGSDDVLILTSKNVQPRINPES